jgi:superfamily II DNA/RNA helicase
MGHLVLVKMNGARFMNPPIATVANAPTTFTSMGIDPRIIEVLRADGITVPTDIQAQTIPDALAGRDVLGRGKTGSGKTLAFIVPMLARLAESTSKAGNRPPRGLILVPTRELANQVRDVFASFGRVLGIRYATVYGGVGHRPQIDAIRRGADVIIACPGRLLDLMEQRQVRLDAIEMSVIDEADHMADLGFIKDVRAILDATPKRGQRLLFSATLDSAVADLVNRYLQDPVVREVDAEHSPVEDMVHHVLHVSHNDRFAVIADLCAAPGRCIVFARTKHGAKRLAERLTQNGVPAIDLHGNLSQAARARNLAAYSDGRVSTLVATDIAARGIHVDDIKLVIHADPPAEHKAFLHRSGRTARAGAAGTVVTIMTDDQKRHVQGLTRQAGITPIITRTGPDGDVLAQLAPGERTFSDAPVVIEAAPAPTRQPRPARSGRPDRDRDGARSFKGPRGPRTDNGSRSSNGPSDGRRSHAGHGPRTGQGPRDWQGPRDSGAPRDSGGPRDAQGPRDGGGPRGAQPSRGSRDTRGSGNSRGSGGGTWDARGPRNPRGSRDARGSRDSRRG